MCVSHWSLFATRIIRYGVCNANYKTPHSRSIRFALKRVTPGATSEAVLPRAGQVFFYAFRITAVKKVWLMWLLIKGGVANAAPSHPRCKRGRVGHVESTWQDVHI